MEKKITKLEVIEMMLADKDVVANEVYAEFLRSEKALREKRKTSKKPTKVQEENVGVKALVLEVLKGGRKTITEIIKSHPDLADFSNQKITALAKQLIESGEVTKVTEKGKSFYSLAK